MNRFLLSTGFVLPLLAASAAAGGGDDVAAQLLQADRDFAAAAAARGLAGWLEFMADDVVRLPEMGAPAVCGKVAVAGLDARIFANPARRLVWQPTDAGAFADGAHGYTTGRAQVITSGADGTETVLYSGSYVTVWRRAPDGRWLVILDTGAEDPAPAGP